MEHYLLGEALGCLCLLNGIRGPKSLEDRVGLSVPELRRLDVCVRVRRHACPLRVPGS